jgi:hypothetical protein
MNTTDEFLDEIRELIDQAQGALDKEQFEDFKVGLGMLLEEYL